MHDPIRTEARWLFPRLLFGDLKSTRRNAKTLARAVENKNSWRSGLDGCEMVDIRDTTEKILLLRGHFGNVPDSAQALWRPYWVARLDELIDGTFWSSRNSSGIELLLSGMQDLWFTIGMLCRETCLRGQHQYEQYLQQCVFWLPEIEQLAPRLRTEGGCELGGFWATRIIDYCFELGYLGQDRAELQGALERVEAHGLSHWLAGRRVIERDGDRYRLVTHT